MAVPDNVSFLPTAAEEFLRLQRDEPGAYAALLKAFTSLGKDGPPADTCYVPIQEPPFPNTLAYRFERAGYAVVFESNQRIVARTSGGLRIARAIRTPQGTYTIWAILAPQA